MTPAIAAVVLLATIATSFLSSIFGMLGGLILMGVLVSVLPVAGAMVLHGLIQLTANGYRAFLNRRDIRWGVMGVYTLGGVVALGALAAVAYVPDRATVFLVLGALPFVAAVLPERLALDITRPFMPFWAGFVVVLTNLISGVGGPLLDVFFQRTDMTRHAVVATKAVGQSLGHTAKIIFFGGVVAAGSSDDWPSAMLLAGCVVFSMVGTTLGKRVLDGLADRTFFRWTQRILLGVGAVLLLRGVSLL